MAASYAAQLDLRAQAQDLPVAAAAGVRLLQAKRGTPKNKKLLNMMEEASYKKLVDRVELDFIRDKRTDELDEDLFYSIDEKSNISDLTEKGRRALSPGDPNLFVLPDLSQADEELAEDEEERLRRRRSPITKDRCHQGSRSCPTHDCSLLRDLRGLRGEGRILYRPWPGSPRAGPLGGGREGNASALREDHLAKMKPRPPQPLPGT